MTKTPTTIIGLAVACALTGCSKSLESQIIGKWRYATEVALEDDENAKNPKLRIECDDEFFPNKSVTHDCTFTLNAETNSDSGQAFQFAVAGTMAATGEWTVTKDSVYDKTIDGRFEVESFTIDGQKIEDEKMLSDMTAEMSKLFMKGETTVMKSISMEKDKWVFEEEIEKNKVMITAKRS